MKSLSNFLLYFIFTLIVLAAFLFTIRNPQPVALWFGVELASRPLSVWLIGTFIIGGLTGLLIGAGLWSRLKTRFTVKQLNQKIVQQSLEINQLQTRINQLEATTRD